VVDNGADGVGAAATRARINTLHADTGKGWAALRADETLRPAVRG